MFKDYHYLDGNINKAARCYLGIWDNEIVAFCASLAMPSGTLKNAWRSHRTVILPDYQGMGMGVRFSNGIGEIHVEQGCRFFSRTAHPKMGYYREHSPLWVATSKNKKLRKDVSVKDMYKEHYFDNKRICFSHEFIGNK